MYTSLRIPIQADFRPMGYKLSCCGSLWLRSEPFFFKYARTLWCTLCNETALVDWATSTKWGNSKLHCVKSCTKSFFSFQICLHSRNHSLYSCGPDNDLCFRSLLVWITTKSFSFQASKCDLISWLKTGSLFLHFSGQLTSSLVRLQCTVDNFEDNFDDNFGNNLDNGQF